MTGHQRERQAELRGVFSQLMGAGEEPPADRAAEPGEQAPSDQAPGKQATTDQVPDQTAPRRRRQPVKRTSSTGGTRAARKAPAKATRKAAAEPMPVAQASTDAGRPERLMVPLSADEARALRALRLDDGVPAAARVRAMLHTYRTDERVRRAVDRAVIQMR